MNSQANPARAEDAAELKSGRAVFDDEVHGRGIECYVGQPSLLEASRLIGQRVTVVRRVRRDYLGSPIRVANARVEEAPQARQVSVGEMGGALRGGPDSGEWLRGQRGG